MTAKFCLLSGVVLLNFTFLATAQSLLEVKAEGNKITFQTEKKTDLSVKIFNEKGEFVRTILCRETKFKEKGEASWDGKDEMGKPASPGKYLVKVQAGLQATLDTSFGKSGVLTEDDNPKDIKMDNNENIYVLGIDADGWLMANDKGNVEGRLCKYDAAGKPKDDFNQLHILGVTGGQNFILDDDRNIYVAAGNYAHCVTIYDATGNVKMTLGGWKPDDHAMTPTPGGVAFGPEDRIYINLRSGGDGLNVYQRRGGRGGINNFLYGGGVPGAPSDGKTPYYPRMTSSPAKGWIYLTTASGISKVIDNGNALELANYACDSKDIGWQFPLGIYSDGQNCLWVADRLGAAVYRIWDSGKEFQFVWRLGDPGEDAAKGQFHGPRSVALNKDLSALYVVEDGTLIKNVQGLKRITKYLLRYSAEKTLTLEIK